MLLLKSSLIYIFLSINYERQLPKKVLPQKIHICNAYIPNSHPIKVTVRESEQLIEQIPETMILFGEFNSHHSLWGSSRTDNRDKMIEKLLTNPALILLNTKNPTHFNMSNGSFSAIDLSICSTNLALNMK